MNISARNGAVLGVASLLFVTMAATLSARSPEAEPRPADKPNIRTTDQPNNQTPRRIISIVPAVTEILFAIGAGPQVVGVSSFDAFPAEVRTLPKVGALIDPDLERMLSLRPDLVAVYGSQTDLVEKLARAQVPVYRYRHAGLADVTDTIRELGTRVGHAVAARTLAAGIEAKLAAIRQKLEGQPRPRTLIVLGRESGALRGIYASGGVGFIHDMVEAAGGRNVFSDVRKEAVQATTELILAARPDVILELRTGSLSRDELRRETAVWNTVSAVPAVRSGRVILLVDDRTVVPGPRIAEGTEAIARALHPEVFRR